MDNKAMSLESISADVDKSTIKLAESNGNLKDPGYDPFEHREVEHPNTFFGALAHLLKGSLGAGVLAMPMAFKNAGLVFGLVGTIVVGFVCTHCVQMLVEASHTLCRRENIPSLGFAETAEIAFRSGPPFLQKYSKFGRRFVNGALCFTYYVALCVYVVFIATTAQQLIGQWSGPDDVPNIRILIAAVLLVMTPLGLVRNLKFLVPFSAMADIFIVISFIITLYYIFRKELDTTGTVLMADASDLPIFFATAIFAMEGIGVVMPLENSMKEPQKFLGCPGVLNIAMCVVVALYAAIGFFGYLRYNTAVEGSITLNLEKDEVPAQVVKVLYAISILFSCGLQFYVPTAIIWPNIEKRISKQYHNMGQNLYRIAVCCVIVGVAAAVPELGPIISLIGAICFSTLGLFCPAMIDTITRWEGGLGWGNWRLYKNILIIIFSILALVMGSYTSILEIIDTY